MSQAPRFKIPEANLAPTAIVQSSAPDAMRPLKAHAEARGSWREALIYRELLFFLSWRDVKVRYKQTALGVLWAVIQPLFTMALFTILFGRVAKISSDGVPRPVFYFSGLLPWLFLQNTVSNASMSLVSNANLLTKIYFPRFMLPASVMLSGVIDFLIGTLLLSGFLVYYHTGIGWGLVMWPLLVVQMAALALALGLFLSAINVRYRDVKYAIPFMMQVWMYLTPVIYPVTIIPIKYRPYLALNPAAGLVESFRHALVPSMPMHWSFLAISAGVTLILLIAGFAFFRRTEKVFADVI